MTPPPHAAGAATATARGRAQTAPLRRAPRRVSGPVRRSAGSARAGTLAQPLGVRLAGALAALPDQPLVDRLVRGRAWIGVLGAMLIGIVAMQVSLLQLNAGIGRDVERSAALDRANGELRANVSKLSSGERIQAAAARFGMISPVAGQVEFGASKISRDAAAAARALRAGAFADGAEMTPISGEATPPGGQTAPAPSAGSVVPTSVPSTPQPTQTAQATVPGTAPQATSQPGVPVPAAPTVPAVPQAPVPAQPGAAVPAGGTTAPQVAGQR